MIRTYPERHVALAFLRNELEDPTMRRLASGVAGDAEEHGSIQLVSALGDGAQDRRGQNH